MITPLCLLCVVFSHFECDIIHGTSFCFGTSLYPPTTSTKCDPRHLSHPKDSCIISSFPNLFHFLGEYVERGTTLLTCSVRFTTILLDVRNLFLIEFN